MPSTDHEPIRSVHDRAELAALFLRDPALHAYELGDLDDFFWPYTTWYRRADNVALVYHGSGLPTLLALAGPDHADGLHSLLRGVLPLLPRQVYAHVSVGAGSVVAEHFAVEPRGLHLKMALTEPGSLDRERRRRPAGPGRPAGAAGALRGGLPGQLVRSANARHGAVCRRPARRCPGGGGRGARLVTRLPGGHAGKRHNPSPGTRTGRRHGPR